MNSLTSIGEAALIERLTGRLASGEDVIAGPGDDCAVVRAADEDWLLTSDPVIEGVHFKADADPAAIGHKAVARALSDIAAMGGTPRWALVDLVARESTTPDHLEAVYDGMSNTAARYGISIVGGDVARGPVLELHLFAVGSVPRDGAVLRSGATPGDSIFVTGTLGGSHILGRHLTFEPRLYEGEWLRDGSWATAMCDISDGLATDLHHLVKASGVGAELQLTTIPCAMEIRAADDAVDHALRDGEDFELLFTVSADRAGDFKDAWGNAHSVPCTRIGTITPGNVVEGVDQDGNRVTLTAAGFDHFSRSKCRP